ncbi:hypothetical protein MPLA_790006 [Mesorhizobium sp. ORS 3359]|nr:hypothetical protein MPLA_790006 [Mesorhizobium sp. ORS 3359]
MEPEGSEQMTSTARAQTIVQL